ncbi:hypothetical protein TSAR_010433 [Trichomalopsis sarcophagae]|uniref:Uncharacterized protein n=1 Tax=Trichomalopsis sarcophagae TaxID=543379 RepID=A0A232F1Q6_9HYME|nr:hypothetical protein TSAR_010433 [Trichomalopsis sarcophagae]
MTIETWPFKEGTHKNMCRNIKISANRLIEASNTMVMYLLPQGRILIGNSYLSNLTIKGATTSSTSRESRELQILDMSTCTTRNVKPDAHAEFDFYFPALHKDGFEMLLSTNKGDGTKNKSLNWNSYNFEGQKIGYLKSFVHHNNGYLQIIPASDQSTDKGFYVLKRKSYDSFEGKSDDDFEVTFTDSSSSDEIKLISSRSVNFVAPHRATAFSTTHDLFSICYYKVIEPHKLFCAQFNTQIHKFRVTLELPEIAEWITLRNLPDGGFILATGHCENIKFEKTDFCRGFRVQKVAANGKSSEELYIDGLQLPKGDKEDIKYDAIISENNKGEYCFIWVVASVKKRRYIIYEKRCISNKFIT